MFLDTLNYLLSAHRRDTLTRVLQKPVSLDITVTSFKISTRVQVVESEAVSHARTRKKKKKLYSKAQDPPCDMGATFVTKENKLSREKP